MVNPAGKAPSKTRVRRAKDDAELLAKHRSFLTELVPSFNRLSKKDQHDIAIIRDVNKIVENNYQKEGRKVPEDVSDDSLKQEILRRLGVSRRQMQQSPKGYSQGGMVHRGRQAGNSAEKAR